LINLSVSVRSIRANRRAYINQFSASKRNHLTRKFKPQHQFNRRPPSELAPVGYPRVACEGEYRGSAGNAEPDY
jgi:hypothetical protein